MQRRKYQMAHELRLSVGALPVDAFQKGYSASASYTLHFDNYIAWEIFQLTAAYLVSTNLRDELIDTFAVPPEDFAAPRFMLTTGLELTPFYGKQSLFNDTVLHQSLVLGLYGGVIFGDRVDIAETLKDIRPAVGVGLGFRVFMTKLISARADLRYLFALKRAVRANESFESDNVLLLTIAVSFNVFRDDA